jgi:hypothetical protein
MAVRGSVHIDLVDWEMSLRELPTSDDLGLGEPRPQPPFRTQSQQIKVF